MGGGSTQLPALRSCRVAANLISCYQSAGGSYSGYRPGARWPSGLCQGGDDVYDLKAPICFRTCQCWTFPPYPTFAPHTEAQKIVSQAPLYCRI